MIGRKKIVRLFSRLNVGGPSLHVVNLTVALKEHGYDTLLVVGTPDPTEGNMHDYAFQKGVTPHFIPEFQAALSPLKDLKAFYKIWRLLLKEKPLIVHTHTFKAGLLGRLAARMAGVPYVVHTYHGHLLKGYGSIWRARVIASFERVLGWMTDYVLAVSQEVADDIAKAGIVPRSRISALELGFDMDWLNIELQKPSSLRSRWQIPADHTVVGIVGRLVKVKSVDMFLCSLVPLLNFNPRLHLAIIGDGPEFSQLQLLANDLASDQNIRNRIHFSGYIVPAAPELKDIDLCICSSKNEGTSVSIIEAVIAGCPVISTHVGGMGDLLQNGKWGRLVPYEVMALRAAVEEYLRILQLPLSDLSRQNFLRGCEEASRHFQSRFHLDRLAGDIVKYYSRVEGKEEHTCLNASPS